jgi:hypothetical protein
MIEVTVATIGFVHGSLFPPSLWYFSGAENETTLGKVE